MPSPSRFLQRPFTLALLACGLGVFHGPASAESKADDFASRIGPILLARCVDCHSGEKPAARLDMTTQSSLMRGGKSGRAIAPGDGEASLLVERIADGTMPPKAQDRLASSDVETIKRWIDDGANWDGGALEPGSITTDRRAGLDWWSLQPIGPTVVPATRGPGNAIDAFIEQKRIANGVKGSAAADRRTLIRRMTFDLHGLPPTPEEIKEFESDTRADAIERLVDRLLASPRYGERWARHWLDVVRFAESHGYEHDSLRPNAWPYRDYVIRSLNEDKPYDRFVTEQLIGDVLAPNDAGTRAAIGFLVAGPYDEVGSKVTSALMRANVRQDELEDLIGVTGQTFLGLTLQCARCHDHKFDPISQADYYGVAAVFAGVKHGGAKADKLPSYQPTREALAPTFLLGRGDVQAPGRTVEPASPRSIRGVAMDGGSRQQEAARRRAFAKWLVDGRNPLFARVIVNRIWQHHFGQGIVATPSDFGFNGTRPTHPELLDWLATQLIEGGWSMKSLHRLIVLSSTYQQASEFNDQCLATDAGNRWLWRIPPRRLDAEEVRDAILTVSGALNSTPGGKGYNLFESKTNAGTLYRSVDREGSAYQRRSIYRTVVRGVEAPFLASLDCPDASTTTPTRTITTTPLQALSLWNEPFVLRQAAAFAERLKSEASSDDARIDRAYWLAFGRACRGPERPRASAFISKHGLVEFCRVLFNANEFLFVD